MPIYAYKCTNCGFEKDELQKMSAAPLVDCPNCGQPALKKQLTAAGFQLKGSGWYVTDFREGGKVPAGTGVAPAVGGEAAANGAKPADAPAAKSDSPASSGDSKPAASTESGKAATPAPAKPAAPATGS